MFLAAVVTRYIRLYINIHICTNMYIYVYTHTYIHMYIYIYMYTHTHVYIYLRAVSRRKSRHRVYEVR